MLKVIDYGMGNIGSVFNMVRKIGGSAVAAATPEEIAAASKLILPGVGAFDYGMDQLRKSGLVSAIKEKVAGGTPILGICLGMHLLGTASEEGKLAGLGLIEAEIRRFSFPAEVRLPVPHVGWRDVAVPRVNPLISGQDGQQRFYFTHSYHAVCARSEDIVATAEYGYVFTAAFSRGNVYGVQFHPEKSHRFGMALMKRFLQA